MNLAGALSPPVEVEIALPVERGRIEAAVPQRREHRREPVVHEAIHEPSGGVVVAQAAVGIRARSQSGLERLVHDHVRAEREEALVGTTRSPTPDRAPMKWVRRAGV